MPSMINNSIHGSPCPPSVESFPTIDTITAGNLPPMVYNSMMMNIRQASLYNTNRQDADNRKIAPTSVSKDLLPISSEVTQVISNAKENNIVSKSREIRVVGSTDDVLSTAKEVEEDNKESEEVKEENPVTDMLNFVDGIRWNPTIIIETKTQLKTYKNTVNLRTDKALISSSIEDDNNSTFVDIVRLLTLPFHDRETHLHDKRNEYNAIFQFDGYVGIDDKTILIHDIKKAALLGGTCLIINKSYGKRSRYEKHMFYTIFFYIAYSLTF